MGKPDLSAITKFVLAKLPQSKGIWLYGSRATGKAKRSSDYDIKVLVPDEADAQNCLALLQEGGRLILPRDGSSSWHVPISRMQVHFAVDRECSFGFFQRYEIDVGATVQLYQAGRGQEVPEKVTQPQEPTSPRSGD